MIATKLKNFSLVGLLAACGALLPTLSHAGNTNISVIQISQGNAAIQICGSGCVQVLQQNNIAIVAVNQGGLAYVGSAYLFPRSFAFGNVVHAKAQDFTLTNTSGSQPLIIPPGAIGMSGANPAAFPQSNNCPIVLWPRQACVITVTFAPGSVGPMSAVLAVRDSAIDSPNTVDVSGTGVAAWVTPATVDFGAVVVGAHGPGAAVTVHNPGSDSLAVTGTMLTGAAASDFAAAGCGTVASGGTCGINLSFTPTDGGARQASLGITVAGLGGPFAVPVAGAGAPLSLSPSVVDFESQRVGKAQTLNATLKNLGSSALTVTALAVTGANAGDFKATGCGPLPFTIAGGASCSAPITFTPSGAGARGSNLTVDYGAVGMHFAAAATLAGTGVAPGFAFSPGSLDFGAPAPGQPSTQKVTLSNPGGADTTITAISISGGGAKDYSISSDCGPLPVKLAPGASCTVQVTLRPTQAGDRSSTLKVSDDAGGSPHILPLNGSGAVAAATATGGSTGNPSSGTSGTSQTSASAAATTQTGAVSASRAPGLPNTGMPPGSGPRLLGFVSPLAGGIELIWVCVVLLLLVLCAVAGVRRRLQPNEA